jgi:uncharacterized protein YecT (DUF1311 family)
MRALAQYSAWLVTVLALSAVAQTKTPKVVATSKAMSGNVKVETCEPSASLPGVQCMAEQQKVQDRELNSVYRLALQALPEHDSWDSRRNREYLVKAQRAWLQFRSTHCTVAGAQEGGSNMSITFAMQQCEWDLTSERIKFLTSVAVNR